MSRYLLFFMFIAFLTLPALQAHAQGPTTSDLYEALLESKEIMIQSQQERIGFLNNVISWILALSAIIITIAVGTISYIYRGLLNDIKKRNAQLKQQEEVIAKIVEAEEFQFKLNELQNGLDKVTHDTKTLRKQTGIDDLWKL